MAEINHKVSKESIKEIKAWVKQYEVDEWIIPLNAKSLNDLTRLDLSYCSEIKDIPDFIGEFKHKEFDNLSIQYNSKLKKISKRIGELINLRRLTIVGNSQLEKIPESIQNLTNLENLEISLTNDPDFSFDNLSKLVNLKHLTIHLDVYSQSTLPEGLGQLKSLESLELYSFSPSIHYLSKV